MREKLHAKHVVAIVAMLCATALLMPVAVAATTGTAVNIVDGTVSGRKALVTGGGALSVETQPGVQGFSFNVTRTANTSAPLPLVVTTAPYRIAVTQLTLSADSNDPTHHFSVDLAAAVRTSGTAPCETLSGYSLTLLRQLITVVDVGAPVVLDFPETPMLTPKGAPGQAICLFAFVGNATPSSTVAVGVTGFKTTH